MPADAVSVLISLVEAEAEAVLAVWVVSVLPLTGAVWLAAAAWLDAGRANVLVAAGRGLMVLVATRVGVVAGAPRGLALAGEKAEAWELGPAARGLADRDTTGAGVAEGRAGETGALDDAGCKALALAVAVAVAVAAPAAGKAQVAAAL